MARRKAWTPNPLPDHYERETLDEPQPIRFRRRNDTDGRGNNWEKGRIHGYDSHNVEEPCPIVWAKEGGWRTLQPDIWEWNERTD